MIKVEISKIATTIVVLRGCAAARMAAQLKKQSAESLKPLFALTLLYKAWKS